MKLSKASLYSLLALVCFEIQGLSSNSRADYKAQISDHDLVDATRFS